MSEEDRAVSDGDIYDLTELYEETQAEPKKDGAKAPREMIMIDGWKYERVRPGRSSRERVHDLTEIIDDSADAVVNDALMKNVVEIVEKIARELIPGIAERVIREEIQKIEKSIRRTSGKG